VRTLSRAAKVCDVPGSVTNITRVPCRQSASANCFVIAGRTIFVRGPLSQEYGRAGAALAGQVSLHNAFPRLRIGWVRLEKPFVV